MKKVRLKNDVHSVFYDKKGGQPMLLGKRNELVTLIADHQNVWIVENKNKDRYPVNVESLIIQD